MNKQIILFVILIFLTIMGCKENSTEPNGNYSVNGKIIQEGKPLPNASVSLDKRVDLTAQTNSDGEFSIDNVPKGDYTLSVEKTNSDGSFISKSSELSVTDDIIIESLLLPKGVQILEPTDISATSMHLYWTSTDANDFREYKLYRHISSGLDESTGTLVHVSTAISDTQFIDDDINPLTTYYYRIYIMNEYGRLGGSNIVSSSTMNLNLVKNGSFEDVAGSIINDWRIYGPSERFRQDSIIAQDGSKSLKIESDLGDWGMNNWQIYQQIDPNNFEQGKTYEISFWCKNDTLEQYESLSCYFNDEFGGFGSSPMGDFIVGPKSAGDWTKYSFIFTVSASLPSSYYLRFTYTRLGTANYVFQLPLIVWIDNVEINKLP